MYDSVFLYHYSTSIGSMSSYSRIIFNDENSMVRDPRRAPGQPRVGHPPPLVVDPPAAIVIEAAVEHVDLEAVKRARQRLDEGPQRVEVRGHLRAISLEIDVRTRPHARDAGVDERLVGEQLGAGLGQRAQPPPRLSAQHPRHDRLEEPGQPTRPADVRVADWQILIQLANACGADWSFDGPAAVYALSRYMDWLKKYAPPEASGMTFSEAGPVPAQGHIAQQIFWYTTFTADMIREDARGD